MTAQTRGPAPLDAAAMAATRTRWASRAQPPGALGALEKLAVQLAGVTGHCPPPVPASPGVAVFAGDHGVVADGSSAWPSDVTAGMVHTISSGQAAINAFAHTVGATVTVVDVGVETDLPTLPNVLNRRVRAGTASIVHGPAMTLEEAEKAIAVGSDTARRLIDEGSDCLIGGEMGIGNTTPSAALIAAITGRPARTVTGPGAGTPSRGIEHKTGLVSAALERAGTCDGPLDLLAQIGGLEIAALAGFYMAAAEACLPFIADGVITLAALCVAEQLAPGTAKRAVAGHRSTEPAATIALTHLQLEPLLELDLRLGEGTGACLAFPLLTAAAQALAAMGEIPSAIE